MQRAEAAVRQPTCDFSSCLSFSAASVAALPTRISCTRSPSAGKSVSSTFCRNSMSRACCDAHRAAHHPRYLPVYLINTEPHGKELKAAMKATTEPARVHQCCQLQPNRQECMCCMRGTTCAEPPVMGASPAAMCRVAAAAANLEELVLQQLPSSRAVLRVLL